MKYRIAFSDGRWHVTEPSGEVTWHYRTWAEVLEHGSKPGHKIPAGTQVRIETKGGGQFKENEGTNSNNIA